MAEREKIQKRLSDLRGELSGLQGERREELEALADRIELLLSQPGEVDVESLLEELEEKALELEAEHPRLAFFLNDLMEILANLGI